MTKFMLYHYRYNREAGRILKIIPILNKVAAGYGPAVLLGIHTQFFLREKWKITRQKGRKERNVISEKIYLSP